jgi:DNA-binding transcriptional ArsR family regulator
MLSGMEAVLQAIAEPHRRQILELLGPSELSAGEIAARFDVTRPAISQHLSVLSEAGLVEMRKEGTRRIYRARPEGLEELVDYLDRFWSVRLGRLKVAAEKAEKANKTRKGRER